MQECCIVTEIKAAGKDKKGIEEAVKRIDYFRSGGMTSCDMSGKNCDIKLSDEAVYEEAIKLGRTDIVQAHKDKKSQI